MPVGYQDPNEPPFLDTEPPPMIARALAFILLALFVLGALTLVFVQVPETVTAPFTLAPVRGADPVRALYGGTVSDVSAAEARPVKAGERLFAIESETVGDRAAERDALDATLRGGDAHLTNERLKYESQRTADEKEQARLEQRLTDLARQRTLRSERLTLARQVLDRQQKSLEQGLISPLDLSRPQLDLKQVTLELEQIDGDLADTRGSIAKLQADMGARRAQFAEVARGVREELDRARVRRDMLERDPAPKAGGRTNILGVDAPCDGTITTLHARNRGAVVHEGDLLAEIVCAGTALQAELRLPQRGLALVRAGQAVKLMYDAFPYQRYGLRYATVQWVSPSSSPTQDGTFRAFATLQTGDASAGGVGPDGTRTPLAPGMAGRAAVLVGRRSLLSYAVEPIRQIRENLSVPK